MRSLWSLKHPVNRWAGLCLRRIRQSRRNRHRSWPPFLLTKGKARRSGGGRRRKGAKVKRCRRPSLRWSNRKVLLPCPWQSTQFQTKVLLNRRKDSIPRSIRKSGGGVSGVVRKASSQRERDLPCTLPSRGPSRRSLFRAAGCRGCRCYGRGRASRGA